MNNCPICSGNTKSFSHHFCISYVFKRLAKWWVSEGLEKPVFSDYRGQHDVNYNELECAKIKLKSVSDISEATPWPQEFQELYKRAGNPAPRPEFFT